MAENTKPGQQPPSTSDTNLTQAQVLSNVLSLAQLFSTCVEAFNLIHPLKDSDKTHRVAIVRLGLQQGRLLIFGDAVGISSPPATVARYMIPSNPGATNPDPDLPIYFGDRDPRLDDTSFQEKIRAALNQIADRPSHLTREELMSEYGLKASKRIGIPAYPSLDTNRLEAFREKFALLHDLARQTGVHPSLERGKSMTTQYWTVKDVKKFDSFVTIVKGEIDELIQLMGVREQVDKGMKSDIRSMAWHPDLSGNLLKSDWNKLRLIKTACIQDYPEYVAATDVALRHIDEEMKHNSAEALRAAYTPASPLRRKSDDEPKRKPKSDEANPDTEKPPSPFSLFKFAWGEKKKTREQPPPQNSAEKSCDPARSLSENIPKSDLDNAAESVRSNSLSAIPNHSTRSSLDTALEAGRPESPKSGV
jgi:hypothetical protein